jgi:FkbM family methyltransferase
MSKYIAHLDIPFNGPPGFFKNQIYTKEEWRLYEHYFEEVKSIFADREDKQLYSTIVEGRRAQLGHVKNFSSIMKPMLWQYIEFINRAQVKTIIDAGVYNGCQIITFFRFFRNLTSVYGFEPMIKYYLQGQFIEYLDQLNVKVLPLALWNFKTRKKFFEARDETSSRIIKKASALSKAEKHFYMKQEYINTITVDDFVFKNKIKVDYIKLDVEGAEYETLQGAKKAFKKYRPQISVSIYHHKKDLFKIPLLLKNTLENYKYKIAHYSSVYPETVLYAIPNEIYDRKQMISYRDFGQKKL